MKFDVRCGCVAPRAAVGGVRAAQVANRPTADPLTDLLFVLACCGRTGQEHWTRATRPGRWCPEDEV